MPAAFRQTAVHSTSLKAELDACKRISKEARAVIEPYLSGKVSSVLEVTPELEQSFQSYLLYFYPEKAKQYFWNFTHYKRQVQENTFQDLLEEVKGYTTSDKGRMKKALYFLMDHGIHHLADICYPVRKSYETYVTAHYPGRVMAELKELDNLKLWSIQKSQSPFQEMAKLTYKDEPIFLLYHPDYELARTFYYVRDKEELLFDFSLPVPKVLKHQIFAMLNAVLETKHNWHDRRERFLLPLKKLYLFCIKRHIDNLEYLEQEDIDLFQKELDQSAGSKANIYIQIVDNTRKFLFLQGEVNWQANVWYLERFRFSGDRMNPSRPISTLSFLTVRNPENRSLLQEYIRYCLAVTDATIGNIRGQLYNLSEFMQYIQKESVLSLTRGQIEEYFKSLDKPDILPATFNRKLSNIYHFYQFLVVKRYIKQIPFYLEFYLKGIVPGHNDRSVPFSTIRKILENLYQFPEDLRLIYLNLWCTGLRLNEVCTLKGEAYYQKDGDAWLRVYQFKMRAEKSIPIPSMLYEIMQVYLKKKHIQADEYIFQNEKGGAYDAGAFSKKMSNYCKKLGLTCDGYIFRSHDYRHCVGTYLYYHGASIQAVRDYLGHKHEDMTKQYIDYIPKKIDKASDEYYQNQEHSLASILKKGKKNGK